MMTEGFVISYKYGCFRKKGCDTIRGAAPHYPEGYARIGERKDDIRNTGKKPCMGTVGCIGIRIIKANDHEKRDVVVC
ncbi:MAG: hypothetical protein PHW58_06370 [Candidatus Methanofastidiosa archaeon]|nr:hypothetical protein [Candidatus Methanofastidiosa archaeon]